MGFSTSSNFRELCAVGDGNLSALFKQEFVLCFGDCDCFDVWVHFVFPPGICWCWRGPLLQLSLKAGKSLSANAKFVTETGAFSLRGN
jgi:hypothetical protein